MLVAFRWMLANTMKAQGLLIICLLRNGVIVYCLFMRVFILGCLPRFLAVTVGIASLATITTSSTKTSPSLLSR